MNSRELFNLGNLHKSMVKDCPKLHRGKVWCKHCGKESNVDSAECLKKGWPRCCGYTMTIDSPEERK